MCYSPSYCDETHPRAHAFPLIELFVLGLHSIVPEKRHAVRERVDHVVVRAHREIEKLGDDVSPLEHARVTHGIQAWIEEEALVLEYRDALRDTTFFAPVRAHRGDGQWNCSTFVDRMRERRLV